MKFLRNLCIAGFAALLASAVPAGAEQLRDPTRPPGKSAVKGGPAPVPGGLVLQSILNSPERKAAVINGKLVGPGESVDGFMLVGIAEDEAVLKNGADVRRLRLYPAVAMKKQRQAGGTTGEAPDASGEKQ